MAHNTCPLPPDRSLAPSPPRFPSNYLPMRLLPPFRIRLVHITTTRKMSLSSSAKTGLPSLRTDLFINGKFVPGAASFDVTNPCTGELLSACSAASPEQVDAAVRAAATAFKSWRALTDAARAGWLRKLADEIGTRKAHIAAVEAANTGKPLREAEGDVDDIGLALRYCAGLAEKGKGVNHIQPDQEAFPDPNFKGSSIIYEPVGVVGSMLPFNFPLGAFCVYVSTRGSHWSRFSLVIVPNPRGGLAVPKLIYTDSMSLGCVAASSSTTLLICGLLFSSCQHHSVHCTGDALRTMHSACNTLQRCLLYYFPRLVCSDF